MSHADALDLVALARAEMREHGFEPEFAPAVHHEVTRWRHASPSQAGVRDMRAVLWSSIDNEESRDLDQIEAAEDLGNGRTRLFVGIADVDALVAIRTATDKHAAINTASVYTAAHVFPMLPEELSTDLTSLGQDAERLAIVVEMDVEADGSIAHSDVYRALVKNHAKLAYEDIGAWLDDPNNVPIPARVRSGVDKQLLLQDAATRKLQARRYENGALDLETLEARPVAKNGHIVDLKLTEKSRSRDLIEDLMIAANGAMARFLDAKKRSSIRRIVKAPERWARIVTLAKSVGDSLPEQPSAIALSEFLARRKAVDRVHFADVSLAVVKLMGPGEYALERAGAPHEGHFGLAVLDYTHSTAPNRRFADLVTQRLVKAALAGSPAPYSDDELAQIAALCTKMENAATKVERQTRKVAAAVFLSSRIGEKFDAIVTGATPKGTFVRLISPPAEGRVVRGEQGLDVGDNVRVELVATEPSRGFIDFARIAS